MRPASAEWAFGAGAQAITFVSQTGEETYIEHPLTWYSGPRKLDTTPGHEAGGTGVLYKTFDPEPKILRCFQCHSTGQLTLGAKYEIQPAELGVRCEACHGPGRRHAVTADPKLIRNPKRFTPVQVNTLCGGCHRNPGVATDWNDPWNARHQPLYLAESACFRKGGVSCRTCHDPHQPLARNSPDRYNSACATCHARKPHPAVAAPVSNCVACHMPVVAPSEHLRFANHWIGVYRAGAPIRPVR